MHIDDWIDLCIATTNDNNKGERYARWFFIWKRMPAWMQNSLREFYNDAELFCDYKGKRYRCTGASRMGDVCLTEDFNKEYGYELRVDVEECSNWSNVSFCNVYHEDKRISDAIHIAIKYGMIDGSHHKAWVIDQMVRILSCDDYERIVTEAKAGEDGPDTYSWNEGIAP